LADGDELQMAWVLAGRRPFKDVVIPKRASSNEMMQGFKGARGILVLIGTRFRGGQDSSCAIECDVRLGRGGAFGMTMLYGVIPSDKPADASTP
jgi:hypothetical protein